MEYYRLDFIFSYWIFAWFLLYIIGVIKTPPKFLLIVGVAINLIELVYLFIEKVSVYNLVKFSVINTFLKVIPLYFVYQVKITRFEIMVSSCLLLLYFTWLYIHKVNVNYFYSQFLDSYKTNRSKKTIVSAMYDSIIKN